MCGFLSYFSKRPIVLSDSQELNIQKYLKPRGPDHYGTLTGNNFYLAHSRLKIIDVTNNLANQPIQSSDSVFVFNGEILNYKDLTNLTSDSIFLFNELEKNPNILNFLSTLRGFFAFVYYNKNKEKIIAARDILGQKPLYYYHSEDKLIFSSSLKAIKCLVDNLYEDENAKKEFFLMGRVSAPNTQYKQIKCLMPGEVLESDINFNLKFSKNSLQAKYQVVGNEFDRAVQRRFVSDIPVGLLLSSGYDSSVLLGAAVQHGLRPKCFTIIPKFTSKICQDESQYAKQYAQNLGCEWYGIDVNEEYLRQCYEKYLEMMELPCIDGLNIYLTTKLIKNHVSVLLTGTGGDEVQGRYVHYNTFRHFPSLLQAKLNYIKRAIFRKNFPIHCIQSSITKNQTPIQKADLETYLIPTLLRDADWASMLNGVEVRSAFLDQDLWEISLGAGADKILNQTKKFDLRTQKPLKLGFELPIELLFPETGSRIKCLEKMAQLAWSYSLK